MEVQGTCFQNPCKIFNDNNNNINNYNNSKNNYIKYQHQQLQQKYLNIYANTFIQYLPLKDLNT